MYQSIMCLTIQSYNNFNIAESICWFWLNVYFLWIISIVIRSEMHSGEYGMGGEIFDLLCLSGKIHRVVSPTDTMMKGMFSFPSFLILLLIFLLGGACGPLLTPVGWPLWSYDFGWNWIIINLRTSIRK